ncbi:Metal tolerance protein 12 [Linum perenne]
MPEDHDHRRQNRPDRLSVPTRPVNCFAPPQPAAGATSRAYPPPNYASTPTPTPSKQRLSSSSLYKSSSSSSSSSISFLLLLLFSLRSLYSLLPFLRSSPSFSLFPFSFLVSLLSFLLSFCSSLFSSAKTPFSRLRNPTTTTFKFSNNNPIFGLSSLSPSQHKLLLAKSFVLAVVFLLRFQALRYCGTAAMILAELCGNIVARVIALGKRHKLGAASRDGNVHGGKNFAGFLALFIGLFLLAMSWDRIDCFPFSTSYVARFGWSVLPGENCVRVWLMLLPFMSGFLGSYERVSMNWIAIRQLGQARVRLVSLFYTTLLLFIPAVLSFAMIEGGDQGVSIGSLGWPLANTVVFGVLLSESYADEKLVTSKDFQKDFSITFVCTIVLELFYFPELSLWGLLLCGLLLYIGVRRLDHVNSDHLELGMQSSEPYGNLVAKPLRHILSERKSRKIALFLLINAAYMVVEFVAGFMSNSLGLISDACHMLFDCAALAIGLYASYIARLPANEQYNYGRGRFEVLSGYVNAVFLVLVGSLIVLESFERLLDPQEISTNSLLVVSVGGLVVNIVGLIFFHEEHHHAHGGSGCSHSHSDSRSHSHSHSHSPHSHGHGHEDHNESISISHGYLETSPTHQLGQYKSHHSNHQGSVNSCNKESSHCHDNHHDQHSHDHHHHSHSHHDQSGHHESLGHHHHHENDVQVHSVSLDSKSEPSLGTCCSHSEKTSGEVEPEKHHHHHVDHNMEGIFLHVLADTMGSVGVVISTLLIKYKGWLVADPASSIFISALIISSVIPLLRNSAEILLQRVPRTHDKDLKNALNDVRRIKGVHGIQTFHIWSFTNTDVVGTLHLHVSEDTDRTSLKKKVVERFHECGVKDLTIQVECIK